ncbi:sensor histidine kinase [Actinokineospora xionganensis]|uniref:histidine kinase n=1 Tax=Actinokineospora xionganensis TaxID=2684470 RepID=A0ABR7LBS7_9PSEU|nr:histidine kinase [Actinokineospora xionganensis]MBC6449948.1 sensor histidine kinase [Actinokineospora xionganensis]
MGVRAVLGPVGRETTYRRWVYLIIGGALLVPYVFLASTLVSVAGDRMPIGLIVALILLVMVAAIVVMSFIPAVRVIEGTAARELLGDAVPEHATRRVTSWPARWRTAAWAVLHLLVGGVVSGITLALPPAVVSSLAVPFTGSFYLGQASAPMPKGWAGAWIPALGVLGLLLLVHIVSWCGALFIRLAPVLLGPTPDDELAALRKRAEHLAERNRLARELHDSVGHALSIVTVQAAAARRVLAADPAFVDKALGAIEESARSALEDLDHVLGLLREDRAPTVPQWTLDDLPGLLDRTRIAGVAVESTVDGEVARLPAAVSREAYRIVQECLTNVLRHAGKVPVTVRLAVREAELALDMENPLEGADGSRPGGGRGLAGMRERVTVLRGQMSAGAQGGRWVVAVRIPLRSGMRDEELVAE